MSLSWFALCYVKAEVLSIFNVLSVSVQGWLGYDLPIPFNECGGLLRVPFSTVGADEGGEGSLSKVLSWIILFNFWCHLIYN